MDFINTLSSSKTFFSVAMLVTNLGSRFVIMDLNKTHEKLFTNDVIRKVVVFCMFFVGTRDIMTSIILTFAFMVFIDGLLNEKSRFNIIPGFIKNQIMSISTEQYQFAQNIVEKYNAQHKTSPK